MFDNLLPTPDFRECHDRVIAASAKRVLDCAARFRIRQDPALRLALAVRELPGRLLGRQPARPFDMDSFVDLGREGDSWLGFGLVGAFWQADFGLVPCPSRQEFLTLRRADVCRLVLSFRVAQVGYRTVRLITETSIFCPTPATRRRFAPYWYLIHPVSGAMRRRTLANISRQACQPGGVR